MNVKSRDYLHYTVLGILFLLMFVLQYTKGALPTVFGARPLLLVSGVICASMFLREWTGAMFGLFAGIFIDSVVTGSICFYAIVLMLVGCASGLTITYYLNNNLGTAMIMNAAGLLLFVTLDWLFFYCIPGQAGAVYYFVRYSLGNWVYTFIVSVPLYLLIRRLLKPRTADN